MSAGFFSGKAAGPKRISLPLKPRCDVCKLDKKCQSPKMPVSGKGKRSILIVGEAPGRDEDRQGRPFVGRTGQMLEAELRKLGVDMRADCWLTNACVCAPPKNVLPEGSIDHCRPLLIDAVKKYQPDTVILLGTSAVRSLIGYLWKEDPGGVTRWVGMNIPCQQFNCWICPNWHPSYLLRNERQGITAEHVLFEKFLRQAIRHEGRPWETIPDYRKQIKVLHNDDDAASAIQGYIDRGRMIAFDYENNMLKPDHPDAEVVCCSISDGKRTIAYPWYGKAVSATRDLLVSSLPKVSSNLKHEHRWTRKVFNCEVVNWKWDTMLAAHVLDNRPGITSIKFQAFARLGVEEWDSHIKPYLRGDGGNGKNKIREVDLNALMLYCAYDSLYEYLVAKLQMRELRVD